MNEHHHNDHFNDIDPDTNFYNTLAGYTYSSCKYHVEDTFIGMKQNHDIDNMFSLIHFNARSLNDDTMDNIESFCSALDTKFKVMGISETWLSENRVDLILICMYQFICIAPTESEGVCHYIFTIA